MADEKPKVNSDANPDSELNPDAKQAKPDPPKTEKKSSEKESKKSFSAPDM